MKLEVAFLQRFRGLMRAHGTYRLGGLDEKKGKVGGKALTKKEPVTATLWREHLDGKTGLGIAPLDDEGNCYFGAIDIDIYTLSIEEIEKEVVKLKIPLIPIRTKSGGIHLYLFGSEPLPAKLVREKLMEFSVALGYPNVEIFPKQVKLASEEDVGNWINMPYFKAEDTLRFAIKDGNRLAAWEFIKHAEDRALTVKELKAVKIEVEEILPGAPPCLQYLVKNGFPAHTRNRGLFNLGVYCKKRYGDEWETWVEEMNNRYVRPLLKAKEVEATLKSLKKKDYGYLCREAPVADVCNKTICLTKEFGVGGSSSDPGVELGTLVKILTDPPTWIMEVNGHRIQIESTRAIIDQMTFGVLCVDSINVLPSKVKQPIWEEIIRNLLGKVEEIEAPEDATVSGYFMYMVEEFCTERALARTRDELLMGKPWSDKGKIYFRSHDLMRFLEQKRVRDYNLKKAWSVLREHEASTAQFQIKGRCVRCWSLPEFARQTEGFDVPQVTDKTEF